MLLVGDKVEWETRGKKHTGKIVWIVPAGDTVSVLDLQRIERDNGSISSQIKAGVTRTKTSYLVLAPRVSAQKPLLYWPKSQLYKTS